jgi:hypothetical protein
MSRLTGKNLWIPIVLVFTAASMRVLPHPPNFTPIGAMALLAGATISRRFIALAVSLLSMLVSDFLFFGGYHNTMVWVYASFSLITLLAPSMIKSISVRNILPASIAASVIFFLVTNFGVWFAGDFYSKSFSGLMMTYSAGIPFFGNTLMGDVFFTAVFFSSFMLTSKRFAVSK